MTMTGEVPTRVHGPVKAEAVCSLNNVETDTGQATITLAPGWGVKERIGGAVYENWKLDTFWIEFTPPVAEVKPMSALLPPTVAKIFDTV